ncbi:hypothetical protein DVH05_027181 [Phytophthora capsici]|nr:hypothetical protein DVH05_027181 [Phytophthora capsici]
MVEEYQQAYMTKEKGGLKSATAVMATALQDIEKFPSVAEDCGTYLRQGKHLATRTVNAFSGSTEWSHSLMAYALAGNRSYLSSGSFWYVFPYPLVVYLQGEHSNSDCSDESSESSSDSEISDSEGGTLEERMEALIDRANERDSARFPGDATGRNGGARMYKVDGKILLVTQAESYRHRGEAFKEFSALEFKMIVDILPRRDEAKLDLPQRGRPRRPGFDLAPGRPLCPAYQGFIRTKFRTAMLGGRHPPRLNKDGTASEALSSYLIALVVPWGLDTGTPLVERTADGLVSLCKGWNHSSARFIDRQRYRCIDNLLQKGYRSAKNEKTCSEWRSRNADFWRDSHWQRSQLSGGTSRYLGYEPEEEDEFEAFENSELAELVAAAAAKDIETTAAVKAARSTFWSIVPPDAREAGGPHRGVAPVYHTHITEHVSLAPIARAINKMCPCQEQRSKPTTTRRGPTRLDSFSGERFDRPSLTKRPCLITSWVIY